MELTQAEQTYFKSGGETVPEGMKPEAEVPISEVVPVERDEPEQASAEPSEQAEKPEEKKEQPRQKLVPHEALHEERMRRQALARQFAEEREARIRLEERFQILTQQPENVPNVEEDPVGYFQHEQEQKDARLQRIERELYERQQSEQYQRYQSHVLNTYKNSVTEAETSHPDFKDAYNFLINSRVKELEAAGYPHAQAVELTHNDEFNIVANAVQNGQNPAVIAYQVAQARGYTPKSKAPTGADKLDKIEKGQNENKSLSGARGGSVGDASIDSLLGMSDDDFMKAVNNGTFKKIAGG